MKILFVDNLLFEGGPVNPIFDLQPHLGLMSLVGVAERLGHHACILDPKREIVGKRATFSSSLTDELLETISGIDFDLIGFTALGCNFPFVINLARRVRERFPGKRIIFGGPHATILHQEVMKTFPWIDIVFRHEAEDTFAQYLMLQKHGDLEAIAGITYRSEDGEIRVTQGKPIIRELDALPTHAYGAYDFHNFPVDFMRIEAGRGCPFSCTFCSTATFFGREYRLRSPERIRSDMLFLNAQYGIRAFRLNHDLFTVNKRKVAEICRVIGPLGFTWGCSARADCVDTPLLETMAQAGCDRMYLGIETGSSRMQKISRKNLDLSLVPEVLETTERLGMRSVTSFIVGYPEETIDDFKETLAMAAALHCRPLGLNTSQIHVLTPEPGTDLMLKYAESMFGDPDPTGFNIPILNEDEASLVEGEPDIFANYLAFPSIVERSLVKAAAKLFVLLTELKPLEIAYVLSHFEEGLYGAAISFSGWIVERELAISTLTVGNLADFLGTRLGDANPSVSIVRIRWAIMQLARRNLEELAGLQRAARQMPLSSKIVMSDQCIVLEQIHSPVDIDTLIASGPGHDGPASKKPIDLILLAARVGESFEFRFLDLGSSGMKLIRKFEEPTSYGEYLSIIENESDEAVADWDQLLEMVDVGLLRFSDNTQRHAVNLQ